MNRLTIDSTFDDSSGASHQGRSQAADDRLFRAALRHSRRVRFLRRAIPASIIILLLAIAGAAYFNPFRNLPKLPLDPGKLVLSGTKITMEAPRLAGFTRDDRPYEVTARAAAQDLANPTVLELKDIHARMQTQEKVTVEMQAAVGMYDTKADTLHLMNKILIMSSSGYKGRLSDAVVDVKAGKVVSESPVEIELPNGSLNANRLEMADNGELIRFGGGVQMDLVMNSPDPQTKAPAQ